MEPRAPLDPDRYRRILLPDASGRMLSDVAVLQILHDRRFYLHQRQACYLLDCSKTKRAGLCVRPATGGGAASFWIPQAKVTFTGSQAVKEHMLGVLGGFTAPWSGAPAGRRRRGARGPVPGVKCARADGERRECLESRSCSRVPE